LEVTEPFCDNAVDLNILHELTAPTWMNAAIFEPHLNSDYAKRPAQLTPATKAPYPACANPRRSPLPSASEIDAALQRKYGARRYCEI
jgi:hypothetical protein